MNAPKLYHWLGSEAEEAAREEKTRQQLERELPVGVDLADPQADE